MMIAIMMHFRNASSPHLIYLKKNYQSQINSHILPSYKHHLSMDNLLIENYLHKIVQTYVRKFLTFIKNPQFWFLFKRIILVLVPKTWNPMYHFYFGLEKIINWVMVPFINLNLILVPCNLIWNQWLAID
jgi:hypothetical protein